MVTVPSSLSSARRPRAKSTMSGTCAKTLLAATRSALPCSAATAVPVASPEELADRVDALGPGHLRDVRRRLDAEAPDAEVAHVLQEVAVVAGDLDHEGVLGQAEPDDGGLHVALGVRHPGVGVGGEVRVVAEDVLAREVRRQLDQQARGADPHVERVEHLAPVELVGLEVALARR